MSGHSKWATIKRAKGKTDAARGRIFTKLIREVVTAARIGGGDVDANARLRKAVADCRAQQMPADNIKRAIQRGTGEIAGAAYEDVLYEGTGAGGTLFLVEGTTDNRNRSAAELRKIFERHNGVMGGSGGAQWAFDRLGTITLDLFAVLLGGAVTILPMFADDIFHAGPSGLGWLRNSMAVGAVMPRRTLSPRMSTMVISISSPIMMVSSRCLDRTSMGVSFLGPGRRR